MFRSRLIFLAAGLLLLAQISGQPVKNTLPEGPLRAGFAIGDITPGFPVKLYGYASRKTYSEGVHDKLYARISVFESNGTKVILVSTDLGSFPADVYEEFSKAIISEYGISRSQLFLTAIHSHSSPVLSVSNKTGDTANIRYTSILKSRLLKLIDEASGNMQSVNISAGRGYSSAGSNRREVRTDGTITLGRNPYGPSDKEVLVLKVMKDSTTPVAGIFDYATHATSLGPRNMLISGDVLGIASAFTEKIIGNGVVCPVFAGASGDIDPWYRVLPGFETANGWIPEPVLLGTLLGEEVVYAFRSSRELTSPLTVKTTGRTLEFPQRNTGGENRSAATEQKETIPVNITAACLGTDVAFIGFNVEMFTEIGMRIKEGSPFKYTFVITHCNGYSGYLPPLNLYKEGGYEVTSSRFEPGTAEIISSEALKMLYELYSAGK